MDYCPYVFGNWKRSCNNPGLTPSAADLVLGFSFSADSRCMEVTNVVKAGHAAEESKHLCLHVRCPGGDRAHCLAFLGLACGEQDGTEMAGVLGEHETAAL